MAAIWGIIQKPSNNTIESENIFNKMCASMSVFSFDRIDISRGNESFFACGHQYCSKESEVDVSPIIDENKHLIFCSDCFLYNRDSLIEELADTSLLNFGDSQIAFSAFQRWGYSFVEKLRGNFSFAIYEEKEQVLHLFSDHFSRQYLVYTNYKDFVSFSITFKPVLACLGNNVEINPEFIANSYSDFSPMIFFKEAITPYKNVFQLDYATHVTINLKTGAESRKHYWNPLKKIKKLKYKNDNDYQNAFREIFEDLTRKMLRSKNETGILLSSGLDSSSVAAFAAPMLKERGKSLYSYTSVPCSGYVDTENNPNIIIDESPLVEVQKEFHGNLITHYIKGDNDSCISDTDYFQNLYDMPVKAAINNINIVNMLKVAHSDNCSVILSGENGNATISYGYLTEYLSINLTKFHPIKAYKELSYTCKLYGISRKKFIKKWIKDIYKNNIKRPSEGHYLLKSSDEKKYKLTHPLLDQRRHNGSRFFLTERQKNNFMVTPDQYIQKGFFYTHMGLLYHFVQMDPSLTVEMVEFCLSLPMECFMHHGIERRLVRDYLKDLLPTAITDMHKGFGAQAKDFCYRINREFEKCKENVFKNLDEPLLRKFLDEKKVNAIVSEIQNAAMSHKLDKTQCIEMALLASLGGFLRDHTKK